MNPISLLEAPTLNDVILSSDGSLKMCNLDSNKYSGAVLFFAQELRG